MSTAKEAKPVVTLLALLQRGRKREVRRLVMDQNLQREIAAIFAEQGSLLLQPDRERIPFDAGYRPDDDEVFIIKNYKVPRELQDAIGNVQSVEKLVLTTSDPPPIKALVAVEQSTDHDKSPRIYFQHFTPSRVIHPRRSLFFSGGTFELSSNPGITLGSRMAAVHLDHDLVFADFRSVNAFLDLADYFKEASKEEIVSILTTSFATKEPQKIAGNTTQWARKRFAMLRESDVLTKFNPTQIATEARKCHVTIETKQVDGKDRIVYPDDVKAARKLLQFLNEELYRGPLSQQLYETNSKRAAEAVSPNP